MKHNRVKGTGIVIQKTIAPKPNDVIRVSRWGKFSAMYSALLPSEKAFVDRHLALGARKTSQGGYNIYEI